MVTIEQIQAGFLRYVDLQLAAAFSGWQRAVVLTGGTLIARNIPNLAQKYAGNPAMAAFGVYDAESGSFDIDALHEALAANLDGEKIPVSVPGIGVHGLRHSFASLCYHLGRSERETMAIGGWKDQNTMRKIYTHISEADLKKANEKLAAFFTKKNDTEEKSREA